jgi:pyruvate, water dikinase
MTDYILSLDDSACHLAAVAGGKGANLGRMRAEGVPVPPGFVVTAEAFRDSLTKRGVIHEVRDLISSLELGADAPAVAETAQTIVRSAPPWEDLAAEIMAAYDSLGDDVFVAVRSSACAEDSEAASFAGQQETFLNVSGSKRVLESLVECWASFFSERALFYRQKKGSLADLGMAVVVQRQIASEKSGVMFTIDPIRRRNDQMIIEAVFGLGEAVVSGVVTPDNYVVRRSGILKRARIANQSQMIVRGPEDGTMTIEVNAEKAASQVLNEEEIARLVGVGRQLESAFGTPQDIEWALEGNELYVLQSRPITA